MKPALGGVRFSLLSLLFASLAIGCAATLYFRWEPWALRYSLGGQYVDPTFSRDGSLCAALNMDLRVTIWDVRSGQILCQIADHSGAWPYRDPEGGEYESVVWEPVRGIVRKEFTADGTRLITVGGDGAVRFWDPRSGHHLKRIGKAHPLAESDLSNSDFLLLNSRGEVNETDWNGTIKQSFAAGGTTSLEWVKRSKDGSRIAAGGMDRVLLVWDRKSGKELFRSIPGLIEFARFSPDGTQVYAALQGTGVKMWTIETRRETLSFDKHTKQVDVIEVSPDGSCVFSSDGHDAYLWRSQTGEVLWHINAPEVIEWVKFSADGSRINISARDRMAVHDTATGMIVFEFSEKRPLGFGLSRDEKLIAIPSRGDGIQVWEKRRDEGFVGRLVLPELWGTLILFAAFVVSLWSFKERA